MLRKTILACGFLLAGAASSATPAAAWYDDDGGYGRQREAYREGMTSRRLTYKAWRYRDMAQEAAAYGDRGAASYYGDKARAFGYRARAFQGRSYGYDRGDHGYGSGW